MSLSKSKRWYSNNCLHFLKHAVSLWRHSPMTLEVFLMYIVQATGESGTVCTTLHCLSNLQKWPNKLECYITLGWKGLPVTNTLALWTHF